MSPDAAYYRAWRAAHPEYRERQNALRNLRRKVHGRGSRAVEYAKRASRAITGEDIPAPFTGHELFEQAQAFVPMRLPTGTSLMFHDEYIWQEAMSVAVLAILEDGDPEKAVQAVIEAERHRRRNETVLLDEKEGD